jgi:hypothetical protein
MSLVAAGVESLLDCLQIVAQLDGHVGAGSGTVLWVDAVVDLGTVIALEPHRAQRRQFLAGLHPPVAKHVDQERRFGGGTIRRDAEIHVMEAKHPRRLRPFSLRPRTRSETLLASRHAPYRPCNTSGATSDFLSMTRRVVDESR